MFSKTISGVLLAAFAGLCWGSMGTASQYMFSHCGFLPQDLVPVRLAGAGVFLLGLNALKGESSGFSALAGSWRDFRDVLIYGVSLILSQLTYFWSIRASDAGTASLMVGFVPLFVIGWFAFRSGRRPRPVELLCLLLAVTGVALLVTKGDWTSLDFSFAGVVWGLISAAIVALSTIQPRRVMARLGVLRTVGWAMLTGGVISGTVMPPFHMAGAWTALSFGLYLYIVVFGTVMAFGCYMKSTEFVPPSVSSLLASFEPLTAVILTAAVFGKSFCAAEAAGAALVLANMVILSLSGKN